MLFSDGLVERSHRPYTDGLDELTRLVETAAVGQLWPTGISPSAVDRICSDAVDMLTRRGFDDDVTVLAARVMPLLEDLHVRIPATEQDLPRLRQAVRDWLNYLRADAADQLALELGIGEAVDNAVEHGFGYLRPGTVVLRLQLRDDGRALVRIDDDGIWRPPVGDSRRGTGLSLIASLGQDFTVDGQPTGTTVSFTRRLTRPVVTTSTAGAAASPQPQPPTSAPFSAVALGTPPTLRVRGPVDALTAGRLRQQLTEHSRGGTVALTVDLTDVSHLTSVGVAALADLLRAGERGGQPAQLVAQTGSPAAFVLDLVGLPRTPEGPVASSGDAGYAP